MAKRLDAVIQRYLHKESTPDEEKWLLEQLLIFYNVVLQMRRLAYSTENAHQNKPNE